MLKALEISGFKSFADKTRFEFPPGITVVVGPNGSGKSNIVDAIKWVLGEQSAKSLRGKDMSDVIFKGSSGAGARKPANSATAMLILDNKDRRFPYDADEVHVGRRVYRSGETEYLINGENSRLKDVRDMFRGTGIGTDAYSLIEQGKVDRLLQANAKDRRAIFEEAAGISRFKAKKVEAERRLARVDANLIRLADIVEEVGSRYRSVKSQASKAVRYKEYSERLKQLRTYVGMKDWRAFSEKLEQCQAELESSQEQADALQAEIQQREEDARQAETQLDKISGELQQQQEVAAELREKIAQVESAISLNESRLIDLSERDEQLNVQIQRSGKRSDELKALIETTQQELESAELVYRDSADELKRLETRLAELDTSLGTLKSQGEKSRFQFSEVMALITEIGRLVSAGESQHQSLTESRSRYQAETDSLHLHVTELEQQFNQFLSEKQRLQSEAEVTDGALAQARSQFDELKTQLAERQEHLNRISNQHAGLTQRAKVIEELEKRLEGVNAGAKELLQLARSDKSGPFSEVVGLVADLLSVNVQHAEIVDVALGEVAQYVVVDGDRLVNLLADEKIKVHGRVGVIQLDAPPTLGTDPEFNLSGVPGVIGRADKLVQVTPPFAEFVRQLLGGTWVVKSLGDAIRLHQSRSKNVRFVTLDGEVVEADGTILVGPKSAALGLVSRRSELRELHRELQRLAGEIEAAKVEVDQLKQSTANSDQQVQRLIGENTDLSARLSEQTSQANVTEKQLEKTRQQLAQASHDLEESSGRLRSLEMKLIGDRENLVTNELQANQLNQFLASIQTQTDTAQSERLDIEKRTTLAKVKLAKCEQQLGDLQSRCALYQKDFEEHLTSTRQLEAQLVADSKSRQLAETEITEGREKLADFTQQRESLTDTLTRLTQQRSELDAARRKSAIELSGVRDQNRTVNDHLHQAHLRAEQLTMQRVQLAERLQDDYGIDIGAVENVELSEEELAKRDQFDEEITKLRKKIGAIGSVNEAALEELEELEGRYLKMDEQYQDLIQAKETLEKIIVRINADSRKLFVETLEAIRVNFQRLFRQTFGGGKADILLEEGVDPLEAGVEIVATPPGKPEFNNSLLSGGEKALTAVSLLMAIFQFRPSPFCVLDEVDAPFDEANIGRFIDVLKSFLGWTKFVIVTHSKKTMTAATTLYGITMQESGVSKRVSVRFEDVSEDGHISEEAISRTEEDEQRGVA
jgi:chromosome segregation protein